ncbi:MAG: hypothetical protein ACLSTO_01090 [Bilophila wadsworthia]
MERMRRLCSAFGGLRVTCCPEQEAQRPSKVRIARLLESGKAPGVALEIGVTERYACA